MDLRKKGTTNAAPTKSSLLLAITLLAVLSPAVAALDTARMESGFRHLESLCFACHNPEPKPEQRVAPPISAIKRHYLEQHSDYQNFSRAITRFIDHPSTNNALLRGAIKRFGLMPRLSIDAASAADIAYYLYHAELEDPAWFAEHYEAEHGKHRAKPVQLASVQDYLLHGQQLAMQTKATLGSALKGALKTGGPSSAIDFCHTEAVTITDAATESPGSRVYRVSDKPRNPENQAGGQALAIIEGYKAQLLAGKKLSPILMARQQRVVGYYPIVTNGMCLQCHGQPGIEISASTLKAIDAKYPTDQARGYSDNELRGLFVVEIPRSNHE